MLLWALSHSRGPSCSTWLSECLNHYFVNLSMLYTLSSSQSPGSSLGYQVNCWVSQCFCTSNPYCEKPSAVAQWPDSHFQSPYWVPLGVPAAPLPFRFPASNRGTQGRMTQSLGTVHPCGSLKEGSSCWLWISSVPAAVDISAVNEWTEALSLSGSFSIKINKSLRENKKKAQE